MKYGGGGNSAFNSWMVGEADDPRSELLFIAIPFPGFIRICI